MDLEKSDTNRIEAFEMWCWRRLLGVSWRRHRMNQSILGELEVGKEFTHQVIIQGDRTIPFEILIKVMYTCSQSEFYKMRLLTIKKGG